jgi:hypothetical protein
MASNDPTDTGGLFIGRRPGTAPVRFRPRPPEGTEGRRRFDNALGVLLLVIEVLLCLSLFGPQPYGWLWVGSQVQYLTGFVTAGITTIMLGCIFSLFVTLMLAKRVDHAWKLVRRAAGHHQERGALERMFAISVAITVVIFGFWFIVIHGPGSSVFPGRPS